MNSKSFIGKFPAIAGRDEAVQAALLEEARHEAFVTLGLAGKAAFYMVTCMLLGFAIAVAPMLLVGFKTIVQLLSLAVGLGVASYLYQRLYRRLLARGLEKVLAEQSGH